MKFNKLLSIAIPTYDRPDYIKKALDRLKNEIKSVPSDQIEIFISDNSSGNETKSIVDVAKKDIINIRYKKNSKNIGSDENIAQCFYESLGKYVLIMGDDDLIIKGKLKSIFEIIRDNEYGIVCLRPYGFNNDDLKELPYSFSGYEVFTDPKKYIFKIRHLITLISVCIINKSFMGNIDARVFCGSSLVQVNLCIFAALRADKNLIVNQYHIAVKRNNSSDYDRSEVFVTNLLNIYDSFLGKGLNLKNIKEIENKMIIHYYPFYLYKLIKQNRNLEIEKIIYERRFKKSIVYQLWLRPVFYLPRTLAIIWLISITIIGRLLDGDLIRAFYFLKNKLF